MRLLRLGNSYDSDERRVSADSKASVCDRTIFAATGEEVETTVRVIWPEPQLPDLIHTWLERYEPDLVLLVVSSYWFTAASVPLALERRLGRAGRVLGRWGQRAVRNQRLAKNGAFDAVRQGVRKSVGGATHFSPAEVDRVMEASIRRIVAREDVALVVRGPRLPYAFDESARARAVAEERRQAVHRAVRDLCGRLHVEYVGYEQALTPQEEPSRFEADMVHGTLEVQREQGAIEGEALVRAWQRMHSLGPKGPTVRAT